MEHPISLSVIGLGVLGRAVASVLLQSGHRVHVWNRTPGKDTLLLKAGACVAHDPRAAVEASELVFLVVSTYELAIEVLGPARSAGSLAGRVLVPLCFGTPAEARLFAAWCKDNGAFSLDAIPMCYPDGLGTPEGLTLFAGDADVFYKVEPALAALGTIRLAGAEPGAVNALATAIGIYNRGAVTAFFEAARIVEAHDLSLGILLDTVRYAYPNSVDAVLDRTVRASGSLDKPPVAQYSTLAALVEAAGSDAKTAAACGLHLPVMEETSRFFGELLRHGDALADLEFAYRPWAGQARKDDPAEGKHAAAPSPIFSNTDRSRAA